MIGARAYGLLSNDPARGPLVFAAAAGLVGLPADADAVGVATLVDGAALLSRVPAVRPGTGLKDVVGAPRGRATVIQVGSQRELRPQGPDQSLNIGPFRARSYAAAVVGGPQDPDEAAASRERLLASLPDFLRRFVAGSSEGEAFFLAILGQLHVKSVLDAAHSNGPLLHGALQAAEGLSGTAAPRQVTRTNGVEILHAARGMPAAILLQSGLPEDVAGAFDPNLVDSSAGRERLRRFRGVLTIGALDEPLRTGLAVPSGGQLQLMPEGGAVLVERDLSPRPL